MAEGFTPDGAGTWDAWKFIGMAESEEEGFDSIGAAGEVGMDYPLRSMGRRPRSRCSV